MELKDKQEFKKVDGLFSKYQEFTPEYCKKNKIDFKVKLKALDGIKNLQISEYKQDKMENMPKVFEDKGYSYSNFIKIMKLLKNNSNKDNKEPIENLSVDSYKHQIELYFLTIEGIHLGIFEMIKDNVSVYDDDLKKELEADPEDFWKNVPSNVKSEIAIKIMEISRVTESDKQNL